MSTQTVAPGSRRAVLTGFVIGFVTAFLVAVLALMFTLFERLEDVLVPGALLLSPLTETMARWNGLVNMVLAGAVNGVVYAAVFAVGAAAAAAVRRSLAARRA